jgi:8-oxo-dGTP diphosphatase
MVFLFDRRGRLLLQQRDDHVPPEGYGRWAVPGGGREGNESPRETAIREFEEETTVRLKRLRFFATVEAGALPGIDRRLHLFFSDDQVHESCIEVHEGLDFRYWTPEEIHALPINPSTRSLIQRFLASDHYQGTLEMAADFIVGACVIQLDRWGRVLLQLRDSDLPPERYPGHWSLLGGALKPGESPDAGALREFEEETGHLLDTIRLFRVYRRDRDLPGALVDVQHVYYIDADLDPDLLDVNEGQALRYFTPSETEHADLPIPPHTRQILSQFFTSTAYRAMFH